MIARLTAEERQRSLATLAGWSLDPDGETVRKSFMFEDFNAAFGFMTRVASLAEQADHHPDWSNSYGRVEIALTTHAAHGLTLRDIRLAHAIEQLLEYASRTPARAG